MQFSNYPSYEHADIKLMSKEAATWEMCKFVGREVRALARAAQEILATGFQTIYSVAK